MEKHYYSAHTLSAELASYERRFGMSSAAFLSAYKADRVPEGIPRFDAFTWATTFGELARLRNCVTAPRPGG